MRRIASVGVSTDKLTIQSDAYGSISQIAITGGTGTYRDARGVMELKSRAGGTKIAFIFHFAG